MHPNVSSKWMIVTFSATPARYSASFTAPSAPPITYTCFPRYFIASFAAFIPIPRPASSISPGIPSFLCDVPFAKITFFAQ